MPHQCVRCGEMYDDGAAEILQGCPCGSKLYFYIRKEKLEEAKNMAIGLSKKDKQQIEKDVFDIIGDSVKDGDDTIVLDFESIRAIKPGIFELDLINLFNKKNPLVFQVGEGKYMIDVPGTFDRRNKMDNTDLPDDSKKEEKK